MRNSLAPLQHGMRYDLLKVSFPSAVVVAQERAHFL